MRCRECDAQLPAEARYCLSCGTRIEPEAPDGDVDPLLENLRKAIGFQYRIERLLGRGGMGAVYLAHELALDRDVAIKVLPPEQASTPQMRERFRREARTAARLSHPNIVPLYTFGEVAGLVYFVMGYVAGESLASRLLREGPFPPEEARTLLAAICDALDYAHRQGIVHRDIKPDNILIDVDSGVPLLTDFGIAKPVLAEAQLTMTGQLVGTPSYMSPEQALGRTDVDARSDVYSLGVVAYEMLSGVRPFEAGNPMDALTQRLTHDPKPLGSMARGVPAELALAVDRCLLRDPTKRWSDAKKLRDTLLPFEEEVELPPPARLLRTSVSIGMLVVLASGYLFVYSALDPRFRLPLAGVRMLVGGLGSMVALATAGTLGMRSQGLSGRSVLLMAFHQPSWWRSWYPRALRRRGDVWSRLPRELRRFLVFRGLFQFYMLGILLPLQLMMLIGPHLFAVQEAAWSLALASLAVMFAERRRATKFVRAKTSMTAAEASAILTTPTWRISSWRRPPTSSLLLREIHAQRPPNPVSENAETVASDRPTSG